MYHYYVPTYIISKICVSYNMITVVEYSACYYIDLPYMMVICLYIQYI